MTEIAGGQRAEAGTPPFPGGTAVSHLRVYDSTAADGLAGGTPHCHTACTEAYMVIAGEGRVLTLGGDGYQETALAPGSFAWFTPGTIHRLANDSGDLEILVIMANAGLPESGDMVITFPDDTLADPVRYAAAASLPRDGQTTSADDGAVRARRDLANEGFAALVAGGPEALHQFHQRCASLVAPKVDGWGPMVEVGPAAALASTVEALDALRDGSSAVLGRGSVHSLPPAPAERRYGCCGVLGVVQPGSLSGL